MTNLSVSPVMITFTLAGAGVCAAMLTFDSLEVLGFKSFADKVRMTFTDGISAIIGPNGCGKSNLADAIAWVLGEQNARLLRGARMQEVIFNGTQKRKASGFAEVTLTLRWQQPKSIVLEGIELSGERVEIARKLYRSGESVYLINQSRCRLRDIRQFLEQAGLGYASYALIEQGQIDAILAAKPLERRALIEEAAQILGYKARRRNAELKLELARQNLLRVNDIILEVERQLRSLKRQAARARRYCELKEEYRDLQRKKFALEAEHVHRQLRVLDEEVSQLKEMEDDLQQQLLEREKACRESVEKRERLEELLSQLRQKKSQIYLELDRTENSIGYHEEQIETTRKYLENNAAEQKLIGQSLEKAGEEMERFQSEQAALEIEESKADAALLEQRELVERYRLEVQETERSLEEMPSRIMRLAAETAALANLKEQLEQRLREGASRRERLERERSDCLLQLEQSQSWLQEGSRAIEEKRNAMAVQQQQLAQREQEKRRLEERVEVLKQQLTEIQNRLIAWRERLQSLQEVELRHSQYSEGVQQVLNHLSRSHSIHASGTLADFLDTQPEYERLIEECLNQELEYVLVDSLEEAIQGIAELKSLQGGRFTFLSLHSSNGRGSNNGHSRPQELEGLEGVYGTLGDIVHMKPEVEAAFRRVLPQRAEAIVVSDLERALHLAHTCPESTFVTLAGEVLAPRGLVSAGSGQPQKLGLLALKREKKELQEKILREQHSHALVSEQQVQEQARLEALTQLYEQSQALLHGLDKDLVTLAHQQQQLETERQHEAQALNVLDQEIAQLQQEQQEQRERVGRSEEELRRKRASQAEAEGVLKAIQNALQQLRLEFSRVQEQFHLAASERKIMGERRAALERTLERVQEQHRSLESRREACRRAEGENRSRLELATATLDQLRSDLQRLQQEAAQSEISLAEHEQEHAGCKHLYQEIEASLSRMRERKGQLQEDRSRLDVERARLQTHLENLAEQCREQLQIPLTQVAAGIDLSGLALEQIQEPYQDLKRRLEEFGPINMTALEEYQENEERCQFMTGQRQDIEQSIADTTRAIQEMNRRSREKFREAFEAINRYFNEVFETLFGGGECGMRLLDEEDLLETGIDIYAQPPGKRLQNAMLLSGGEKALTALALLVALFKYRPSKFCLLDEVDAPLDDANVIRFSNLVRHMSQETQFIIITHNKRTMEMAQTLYGVTMQEPGVSQIVAVRF